jgi:hypothetical protein
MFSVSIGVKNGWNIKSGSSPQNRLERPRLGFARCVGMRIQAVMGMSLKPQWPAILLTLGISSALCNSLPTLIIHMVHLRHEITSSLSRPLLPASQDSLPSPFPSLHCSHYRRPSSFHPRGPQSSPQSL